MFKGQWSSSAFYLHSLAVILYVFSSFCKCQNLRQIKLQNMKRNPWLILTLYMVPFETRSNPLWFRDYVIWNLIWFKILKWKERRRSPCIGWDSGDQRKCSILRFVVWMESLVLGRFYQGQSVFCCQLFPDKDHSYLVVIFQSYWSQPAKWMGIISAVSTDMSKYENKGNG